ncbi:hypothetical protein BJY04DRAFT_17736 [Aspergillus karnatakaensis]|uniref:uncharacterized protein n=1 Tax=Aspergillus karnatakaensis TaxID=1810916 RepID=UPI003CCE218E
MAERESLLKAPTIELNEGSNTKYPKTGSLDYNEAQQSPSGVCEAEHPGNRQVRSKPLKWVLLLFAVLAGVYLLPSSSKQRQDQNSLPPPPPPEPISITELPLPPVITTTTPGACTHPSGCIAQTSTHFQSGDFTPDGTHIVVNIEFIGAPAPPDPASIYTGEQLILLKTNGDTFATGEAWKCLTCGISRENKHLIKAHGDYPHVSRSGLKILWGQTIIECSGDLFSSAECTAEKTHIYPIFWQITPDGPESGSGSNTGGAMRELRLHPDDRHLGWNSFTENGGQHAYLGRLEFNPRPTTADGRIQTPRYDLVNVQALITPTGPAPITTDQQAKTLTINPEAITIGELRGFSGDGSEILYLGYPRESSNIDIFAVHILTGVIRRLTSHPEYIDPVSFSRDNNWFVGMDTRESNRSMFMAGLRGIPPVTDLVTVMAAASVRNNQDRRFFQPVLLDAVGDRGGYFGQRVNAPPSSSRAKTDTDTDTSQDGREGEDGREGSGSISDPNWNGRADPAFSPDGTSIVYWQSLVTEPACGGANPLQCPESTADGGRRYRVMLARLRSRIPSEAAKVFDVPERIPWAMPFPPGAVVPEPYIPEEGVYTLWGESGGYANVTLQLQRDAAGNGRVRSVSVRYTDFVSSFYEGEDEDESGEYVLNGYESVSVDVPAENPWMNHLFWESDLVQTRAGIVTGRKQTSEGGFNLSIEAMRNVFNASGTLTTTVGGVVYRQPENGA